jgi:DNA-binding phage protein
MADERLRRLLAGFVARQRGRGGVSQVARITGLARNTIAKGQSELSSGRLARTDRIREAGAGRKTVEAKHPGWCGPWSSCCRMRPRAIR